MANDKEEPNWKELALRAKAKLEEAKAFIDKVTQPPFVYGIVVNYNGDSVDVAIDNKIMELSYVD